MTSNGGPNGPTPPEMRPTEPVEPGTPEAYAAETAYLIEHEQYRIARDWIGRALDLVHKGYRQSLLVNALSEVLDVNWYTLHNTVEKVVEAANAEKEAKARRQQLRLVEPEGSAP